MCIINKTLIGIALSLSRQSLYIFNLGNLLMDLAVNEGNLACIGNEELSVTPHYGC